jgi:hypothetical protein
MDIYLKFDNDKIKEIIDKNKFDLFSICCKRLGIVLKDSRVVDLGCVSPKNMRDNYFQF